MNAKTPPEPRQALEEVEKINTAIFALEEQYGLGSTVRTLLYRTRIALGQAEHLLKIELGIRKP